jgi:hypothetical protein
LASAKLALKLSTLASFIVGDQFFPLLERRIRDAQSNVLQVSAVCILEQFARDSLGLGFLESLPT